MTQYTVQDLAWAKGTSEPARQMLFSLQEENESLRQQLAAVERQRDDLKAEAHRYQWLRIHGLQRAWVSLGTDCDGQNFAEFKCEFKVPEPPNLPYEDDEGLEWADKDFDAAIDAAISTSKVKP